MKENNDRVLVFPPGQGPGPVIPPWLKPGQGPGPVIPPWLNQGLPQFPPIEDDNEMQSFIVRIRSVAEGEFVVVGEGNHLYATGEQVNRRGIFRLIILRGNRVILRQENGSFIRLDNRDFLVADANRRDATRFNIYQTGDREYVLQAPNGYYVRVRDNDKILVARAENPGPRTRFRFRTID